ncbi:MAG: VanZ family protein [Gammaproteobacteria bacterium]|nr:VanZ family protein [Gammaproteobacteria bacterium]
MIEDLRRVLPLRLQITTLFLFFMWLFFQAYQPWQAIDEDLLYNTGAFDNVTDLSGWVREHGRVQWSDDTGYVSLTSTSRLRFQLPVTTGDLLLSSGKIKTTQLKRARKPWDAARIMVYFEDEKGRIQWSHPHDVGYMSGDRDWQLYTVAIDVPSFAHKGWLELAHYGKSGIASFDEISVKPAVWKQTYSHWQMFFGMFWASIMMWLVLNTHFWTLPWGKPLMAVGLLIIIGVTLPPATMFQVASSGAEFSRKVLDTAEEVFPNQASPPSVATSIAAKPSTETIKSASQSVPVQIEKLAKTEKSFQAPDTDSRVKVSPADIQKLGHTFLFACLGYIAFIGFARKVSLKVLSYSLVLFALSTEILQLVVDGRLFGFADALLDVLGIFAGAVLAWVILHMRQRSSLI